MAGRAPRCLKDLFGGPCNSMTAELLDNGYPPTKLGMAFALSQVRGAKPMVKPNSRQFVL